MNDTPEIEANPTAFAMWEHWCEHPGCKKWGSFGITAGTHTRWLCYDHDPVILAGKVAS